MMTTHEQRIADLESETFRIGHRLDRFAGTGQHLTGAIGELSPGQQALTLDITEIKQELGEVRQTVDRIEHRLGQVEQDLSGVKQDLSRIERGHGELLRAILERLDGTAR